MTKAYTHRELCDVAVKWLKRNNSQKGHGCTVAVSEVKANHTGEIPDAIGFRAAHDSHSVVVEVKVSRSDFLQDSKKEHRHTGGMGNFRYFMCPTGLIDETELPEKWGLLYVNDRGHIKVVKGAAFYAKNYRDWNEQKENYRFDSNIENEWRLLINLFNRIGDEEKLSNLLKSHTNAAMRWERDYNSLYKENKELQTKYTNLQIKIEDNGIESVAIKKLQDRIKSLQESNRQLRMRR